jgi:SAM-dependent methyltransferase
MHPSAQSNCQIFFNTYSNSFPLNQETHVVEIGSQDVNGSLRTCAPKEFSYIGVDFIAAKGVDVVLEDPYKLPFEDESIDIVISSSCFEHSEMFWLVFLEILRILKPAGIFYLNAPSTGGYHRYPVDCWRFYPDSGLALVSWAKRNGYNTEILESYVQKGGSFQDFVGVFLKDKKYLANFNNRIVWSKTDFENGYSSESPTLINQSDSSQNEKKLLAITKIISEQIIIN